MREIRFRQYIPSLKRFHEWGFIGPNFIGPVKDTNFDGYHPSQPFTGLKDSNGVDIFEGDIVEGKEGNGFVTDVRGVVEYSGMAFVYRGKKLKPDFDGSTQWIYTIDNPYITKDVYIEVIGNVYENPDLLKEVA